MQLKLKGKGKNEQHYTFFSEKQYLVCRYTIREYDF